MNIHISRCLNSVRALIFFFCSMPAFSMDTEQFIRLANTTINEANSGSIAKIGELIVVQEQMIDLGISASKHFMLEHPEHTPLLNIVIQNVPVMKQMSLEEIEAQWHLGAYLRSHGFDLSTYDHFGDVFSLLDSIIHPATSYICLKEYQRTKDAALLTRASAELMEVVEHVSHFGQEKTILSEND